MGPTEYLIEDFAQRGHPLGAAIHRAETLALIAALRQRLGASASELDLSPTSLNALEQRLVRLHREMQGAGQAFDEPGLMQLVREIAAYIGSVLVAHAAGEWRTVDNSLWGTEIVIAGPVYGIKDSMIREYPKRVFSLGHTAASTWDAIVAGVPPKLYQDYRNARAKVLRERL